MILNDFHTHTQVCDGKNTAEEMVNAALSMGIAATLVLVCSNIVISLLRKAIPDTVRIPCYIVVIAGFVTVVQLLMEAYLPDLYEMLGVYLALIVVNCIILGRAEMFARKNGVVDSAIDGLGMGVGFIREVFGAGAFAGIEIPFLVDYQRPLLTQARGGFLVFGILIAVVNAIGPKKGEGKRRQISCEGCPSASLCGKVSCAENAEIVAEVEENASESDANATVSSEEVKEG